MAKTSYKSSPRSTNKSTNKSNQRSSYRPNPLIPKAGVTRSGRRSYEYGGKVK